MSLSNIFNTDYLPTYIQGTKSCTYCLHKKQKSIVLKKSCLVDQHSKCDTHEALSKIQCYNCTIFGPNVDDAEL